MGKQFHQNTKKNRKHATGDQFDRGDPVSLIGNAKESSHQKQDGKQIGNQAENAKEETTDSITYDPTDTQITQKQENTDRKEDPQKDLFDGFCLCNIDHFRLDCDIFGSCFRFCPLFRRLFLCGCRLFACGSLGRIPFCTCRFISHNLRIP